MRKSFCLLNLNFCKCFLSWPQTVNSQCSSQMLLLKPKSHHVILSSSLPRASINKKSPEEKPKAYKILKSLALSLNSFPTLQQQDLLLFVEFANQILISQPSCLLFCLHGRLFSQLSTYGSLILSIFSQMVAC